MFKELFSPLPIGMALLAIIILRQLMHQRRDARSATQLALRLTYAVFAGVLLAKMLLNARIYHYGFVLAMPSTLLVVVALVEWLPDWVVRRGGYPGFVHAVTLAVGTAMVSSALTVMDARLRQKTYRVGAGVDALWADERGAVVQRMLEAIRQRVQPDETLLVAPEGEMLNYLARRRNPTPYITLLPLVLNMFDEDRILAAFAGHPPDFVAVVRYGSGREWPVFGQGYGKRLSEWIHAHYQLVHDVSASPAASDPAFGIGLLKRIAASSARM